MDVGPRTSQPNKSSKGEKPVLLCGTSLVANSAIGSMLAQSSGLLSLATTVLKVRCHLSSIPLDWGWYGEIFKGLTPRDCSRIYVSFAVKALPLSLRSSSGTPNREKIWMRASTTVLASTLFNGIASGYLDA